jgi:hypothetical protein
MAVLGLFFAVAQQYIRDAPSVAKAAHWGAWITFALALFLVFVAQYDAFSLERTRYEEERTRYEEEAAKNILPEIRGEASNFRLTGMKGSTVVVVEAGVIHHEVHGGFSFDLDLYNCRPRSTNFQRVELDGSMLCPPVEFSFELAEMMAHAGGRPVQDFSDRILNDGMGVKIAGIMVEASVKAEVGFPPIDLQALKVYVVDGLRGKHLVSVREGESLSWD